MDPPHPSASAGVRSGRALTALYCLLGVLSRCVSLTAWAATTRSARRVGHALCGGDGDGGAAA